MSRRTTASVFASPVLVGALTTLVITVAVFLAYNANNGLPFVPTRQMKVELPGGAELVKGNEVREGGVRIGLVEAMSPARLENGRVGAILTLKLDRTAAAFPVDSIATVRPRSALGLKYVELIRGRSTKTVSDGGTLPVSQARTEVDLDQVYSMFDAKTRNGAQTDLKEFGNALTGRGADLNTTVQVLPRTFRLLTDVARNLASPNTSLGSLFPALERSAGAVAPVASQFGRSFGYQADTFAAISSDPTALRQTIEKNPDTLAVGTRSFAAQLPFLRDSAAFATDLNTAARELRRALPTLNSALRVGIPVTQRSQALYGNLQGALGALLDLARAPTTNAALRGLEATVATVQPQVRYLGPFITVCNTWNTFWTMVAEHLSTDTWNGSSQRALVNFATQQSNSYGNAGSAFPANGQNVVPGTGPPVYFHGSPYGHAIDSAGNADCVYGQTGYVHRALQNGPADYNIDMSSANTPFLGYRRGSTYATYASGTGAGQGRNPDHVPAGETFTASPGGITAKLP